MKHLKEHWKTYLTLLNTFLCVLIMSWCFIVPSINTWKDVYTFRLVSGNWYSVFSSAGGYDKIKMKADGDYYIIKLEKDGEVREMKTYRSYVTFIDYL